MKFINSISWPNKKEFFSAGFTPLSLGVGAKLKCRTFNSAEGTCETLTTAIPVRRSQSMLLASLTTIKEQFTALTKLLQQIFVPRKKIPFILWGTYDLTKPRVRLLREAFNKLDPLTHELHADIWHGIADKTSSSRRKIFSRVASLLWRYPILLVRYACAPPHTKVVILYPGYLDIMLLYPLAKLRGATIILDLFIGLHETIVEDRALVRTRSVTSLLLKAIDYTSAHLADIVLFDTEPHALTFQTKLRLSPLRCAVLPVGTDTSLFYPRSGTLAVVAKEPYKILFYGYLSPLHGCETIIRACALLEKEGFPFSLLMVGSGQSSLDTYQEINHNMLISIRRLPPVPYNALPKLIHDVDLCLGIFGTSEKASLVIPNKVYEALACGARCITAQSSAIEQILGKSRTGFRTVSAGDPVALAEAMKQVLQEAKPKPHCFGVHELASELSRIL